LQYFKKSLFHGESAVVQAKMIEGGYKRMHETLLINGMVFLTMAQLANKSIAQADKEWQKEQLLQKSLTLFDQGIEYARKSRQQDIFTAELYLRAGEVLLELGRRAEADMNCRLARHDAYKILQNEAHPLIKDLILLESNLLYVEEKKQASFELAIEPW
jgi:hypothetical protein